MKNYLVVAKKDDKYSEFVCIIAADSAQAAMEKLIHSTDKVDYRLALKERMMAMEVNPQTSLPIEIQYGGEWKSYRFETYKG